MTIDLREITDQEGMRHARSIRMEVFVGEQGVPKDIEMDEHDAVATHVLCLEEAMPVATGRLVRMPDGMKLGRVAVLMGHRGKGLGRLVVQWLLGKARESGASHVYANVQLEARDFYSKLGFSAEGQEFMEAGIRHVRMAIEL